MATDGSCLEKDIGPMGWAWVDRQGNYDCGGYAFGTNQVGELTAILQALRAFRNKTNLVIESDSQYAIQCSAVWIKNWKKNNWKNSSRKPVKNSEIIRSIDYELNNRSGSVRFVWVRGHNGYDPNEKADFYAQKSSRGQKEKFDAFEQGIIEINVSDDEVTIPTETKIVCNRMQCEKSENYPRSEGEKVHKILYDQIRSNECILNFETGQKGKRLF